MASQGLRGYEERSEPVLQVVSEFSGVPNAGVRQQLALALELVIFKLTEILKDRSRQRLLLAMRGLVLRQRGINHYDAAFAIHHVVCPVAFSDLRVANFFCAFSTSFAVFVASVVVTVAFCVESGTDAVRFSFRPVPLIKAAVAPLFAANTVLQVVEELAAVARLCSLVATFTVEATIYPVSSILFAIYCPSLGIAVQL